MAVIQNVTLTINKLSAMRSEVIVEHDLMFSRAEILAGSLFVEQVSLRGADPINDDELAPAMVSQLVQARPGTQRHVHRRIVPTQLLDEDRDPNLLGLMISREDEIYAQVSVMPFMPRGAMARSAKLRLDLGPSPMQP